MDFIFHEDGKYTKPDSDLIFGKSKNWTEDVA